MNGVFHAAFTLPRGAREIEAVGPRVAMNNQALYYYGGLEKEKRNFELCKPFRFDLSWPLIGLTGAPTYLRNIETEKSKKEFKLPLSD
jgi:hypothetical protein